MLSKKIILLFILCTNYVLAQNTYTISGTVKDNIEVLPGAGVYLSGYKIATVTNGDGKFTLPNLKPGNYDVLVQMIGYLPLSKNVIITDKSVVIELKLSESMIKLNEVVIKPDPNRDYLINRFKEFFIGNTPNSANCKILNTNMLDVQEDKKNRTFTVKASDFLIIENQSLGYRIKYLLEQFDYSFNTRILFYAGFPTFEEMKGSNSKQKKWAKNREIAYKGSAQHFFTSLYQKNIVEEGFILNKRVQIINKNRQPDSLIEANIKQLMGNNRMLPELKIDNKNGNSLSYWLAERRKPKTMHMISRGKIDLDTLVKTFNADLKMISYKDDLFVLYKHEKESEEYQKSSHYQNRPMDMTGQVSVVQMLSAPIYFYSNGLVYNPHSTLYSGMWSYEKMADSVPMDYQVPIKKDKKSP